MEIDAAIYFPSSSAEIAAFRPEVQCRCTIRRNAAIFAEKPESTAAGSAGRLVGGLGFGSVGRIGGAPRGPEGAPYGVLDLRIDAAQVVRGPLGDGVVDLGILAQQQSLALAHGGDQP